MEKTDVPVKLRKHPTPVLWEIEQTETYCLSWTWNIENIAKIQRVFDYAYAFAWEKN